MLCVLFHRSPQFDGGTRCDDGFWQRNRDTTTRLKWRNKKEQRSIKIETGSRVRYR